jgi:hypothetical protein
MVYDAIAMSSNLVEQIIFGKNSSTVRISICDIDDIGSNPFFYP